MSSVCVKLEVSGDGAKGGVFTHRLRGTLFVLLIAAGYDDSTIMLRTGHRNAMSLRSYHNLRGDMFRMSDSHLHASDTINIVPVMNKANGLRKMNDMKLASIGNIGRQYFLCTGRNEVARKSFEHNVGNERALKVTKRLNGDTAVELNGGSKTNRLRSNVVVHNSVDHPTVHNHYHQQD